LAIFKILELLVCYSRLRDFLFIQLRQSCQQERCKKMSLYSDLQKVAAGVFAEFKQGEVAHVRIVPGVGPADDPGSPTTVETPIAATVAKAGGRKAETFVKNGLAIATDLVVSTGVTEGVTFTMSDMIKIDGVSYKIVGIVISPAAGIPIAYQLIVRR
jgi:hypothetical protein